MRSPAAVSAVERKVAVVVLPSVPVTPIAMSSSAGSPSHHAAAAARAARASRTTMSGTLEATCCSHRTAAAPRSAALAINVAPSAVRPGIATKMPPAVTNRESCVGALVMVMSVDTGVASRCSSCSRAARSRSDRSIISDPLSLGRAVNVGEAHVGGAQRGAPPPSASRLPQTMPYGHRGRAWRRPQREVPDAQQRQRHRDR